MSFEEKLITRANYAMQLAGGRAPGTHGHDKYVRYAASLLQTVERITFERRRLAREQGLEPEAWARLEHVLTNPIVVPDGLRRLFGESS